MEKHKCKLCSRTFANGRALGGHMKAHLAALKHTQQVTESCSTLSSSSCEEAKEEIRDVEDKILTYGLRENPKKSFRLADHEFSCNANSGHVVDQDIDGVTESRNPTRRRSKRTQKPAVLQPKVKKMTLVDTLQEEEDVAMCLIMLSRDKWTTKRQNNAEQEQVEYAEVKLSSKVNEKFECEKCKKKFLSSQALAGHKASHKSHRAEVEGLEGNEKSFKCPFCFKVFGSGQALGGHKRSHLLGSSSCSPSIVVNKVETKLIDLNLPAPVEGDDYSVVSNC